MDLPLSNRKSGKRIYTPVKVGIQASDICDIRSSVWPEVTHTAILFRNGRQWVNNFLRVPREVPAILTSLVFRVRILLLQTGICAHYSCNQSFG